MAGKRHQYPGRPDFHQSNGVALDILQVISPAGEIITDENKWQQVGRRSDFGYRRAGPGGGSGQEAAAPQPSAEQASPAFPNRVEIDNEVSDEYTVVDIYAHDKVGLLYQITKTLKELGSISASPRFPPRSTRSPTLSMSRIFSGRKITAAGEDRGNRKDAAGCLDEES